MHYLKFLSWNFILDNYVVSEGSLLKFWEFYVLALGNKFLSKIIKKKHDSQISKKIIDSCDWLLPWVQNFCSGWNKWRGQNINSSPTHSQLPGDAYGKGQMRWCFFPLCHHCRYICSRASHYWGSWWIPPVGWGLAVRHVTPGIGNSSLS